MAAPHQWSFTTAKAASAAGDCPCTRVRRQRRPDRRPGRRHRFGQARRGLQGVQHGRHHHWRPVLQGTRATRSPHDVYSVVGEWRSRWPRRPYNEASSGWQEASFASPVADRRQHDLHRRVPRARTVGTRRPSSGLAASSTAARCTPWPPVAATPTAAERRRARPTANYWVDPVFGARRARHPRSSRPRPATTRPRCRSPRSCTVTFDSPFRPGTATSAVKRTSDGAGRRRQRRPASPAGTTVTFVPSCRCSTRDGVPGHGHGRQGHQRHADGVAGHDLSSPRPGARPARAR